MARPSKYAPERADRLIAGLRDGMTIGAACAFSGISAETLTRWKARYEDFGDKVASALEEAEARYTQVIAKAAFGHPVEKTVTITRANGEVEEKTERYTEYDWQAARWWLAKRRRTEWGDDEGKNGPPSQVNQFFVNFPPELVAAAAAKARTIETTDYHEADEPTECLPLPQS